MMRVARNSGCAALRRALALLMAGLLFPSSWTARPLLHAEDAPGAEKDPDFEEEIDEATPRVLFYLPLNGDSVGLTRELRIRSLAQDYDEELPVEYADGLVGKAAHLYGCRHFLYPGDVLFRPPKGSLSFWLRWDPAVKEAPKDAEIINGPLAFPDSRVLCTADGKWHHWVVTWNAERKRKTIYQDGKPVANAALKVAPGPDLVKLGWRCRGALDELYTFDAPLSQDEIRKAMDRCKPGSVSWLEATGMATTAWLYPVAMQASRQKRPPPPRAELWELRPAGETRARKRYDLSGAWRVQPFGTRAERPEIGLEGAERGRRPVSLAPAPEPWAYAEMPGSWRPTGAGSQGGLLDPRELRPMARWNDVDVCFYPAAWLERDLTLEALGPDLGVFLVVRGVTDNCDVYANDVPVGSIVPWQSREFNVTRAIRPGEVNRIDVMAGRPYSPCKREGRDGETTWLPSGLSLPAYLEIRRSRDLSFCDVIPMPSFREKKLGVEFSVHNPLQEKRGLTAACRIADTRSDQVVDLPAAPFTLEGKERETKVLSFPWDAPIPWFPDDPHLLDLSLSVNDGERLIDETFPVRFGFREVWAEGGDFRINGVRLCMQGQCHSFPGSDRRKAEETIARLGLIGFRSSIGYFLGRDSMPQAATEATLQAADAAGFLFNFKLYGGGLTAEGERRARRDYFKLFRPHPCVVSYTQCQYGYHGPAHGSPISLGRQVEEKEKALQEYRDAQALVDLCHELAPGSLVAYYQEGVVGDYRSYMQYLGYGTPLQTREEWPRYWAQHRPAAFFGAELDMCCDQYLWKWQKGFRAGGTAFSQGAAPLVTEHAARYFGDRAYGKETLETVKAIRSHADKEKEYDLSRSPNAVALKAMVIKHTTRAWRTYGISYLVLDDSRITYRPDLTLDAADLAYRDNNARFLAYIGGLKGDFASKDHAFYAGELVRKQIILINGKFHPVEADIRWRLVRRGAAEPVLTASETLRVQAGDILKHPVELPAPAASEKMLCAIELQVRQEGESTEDSFNIEVFPVPARPDVGKARIAVADETGDTAAVLRQAGVAVDREIRLSVESAAAAEQALAGADLLVIGRKSLPAETPTVRMLFRAAENGLNIVCFEQVGKELFGLRNDDPNTRHAFISARNHPIVTGLSDEDFRDWRGASNVLEAYPDYRQGTPYGLLAHKSARGFFGQCEFAQWSANGTVATFHVEKPQTGDFTAILSSGFDMLYSPLVELRAGRGAILLCQLDVTNRYGTDPVATLIVNRLLQYGAGARRPEPVTLAWWGSPCWGKTLRELHAAHTELTSLEDLAGARTALIGIDPCPPRQAPNRERADEKAAKAAAPPEMDPLKKEEDGGEEHEGRFAEEKEAGAVSAAPAPVPTEARDRLRKLQAGKDALSAFLERGGVLLVPYLSSGEHVKWLPFGVKIEGKDFYRGDPHGIEVLSGLCASDFFFREVFNVPAIAGLPDGSVVQDCGLVALVRHGKGKVVFCQLHPDHFAATWQRTKVLRLFATILGNLGVGLEKPEAGPETRDLAQLFYSAPALDFNPDQHTSW